jgi:tungstate transport system substrate-binding protein
MITVRRAGLLLLLLCLAAGCTGGPSGRVRLATATAPYETGLLPYLKPQFEARYGYRLQIDSVGSGVALKMAEEGRVDVVLTNDPEREAKLLAVGVLAGRRPVMHNDLLLIGPLTDPAGARGTQIHDAFWLIAGTRSPFLSRGDGSGVHMLEEGIWNGIGIVPYWQGYGRTGLGAAETLLRASDRHAYTITDEATFRRLQGRLQLEIITEGEPLLYNPFSVLAVRGSSNPKGAADLIEFLTDPETQAKIAAYGKEGTRPLFRPGHRE